MAKEWLESHVNFRPLDRARVRQYCRDIASGNWAYNGESLKFNAAGKMIDGQHRCAAIVESGTPIITEVIEGIVNERAIDEGKSRKTSDYLRLRDIRNPTAVSSALAFLVKYAKQQVTNTGFRVSDAMILDMLEQAPSLPKMIGNHGCQSHLTGKTPLRNQCGHVFRYLIARADLRDGTKFWSGLVSGELLERGSALLILREYVLASATKIGGKRPDSRHVLALCIKAWNAYRKGKVVRNLVWRRGGEASEDFPAVHGFETWRTEAEDGFTLDDVQKAAGK